MIVLVSGAAHSGKGVVTGALVKLGFKEMSFALPIKLWAMKYFGFPSFMLFSSYEEAIRAGVEPEFGEDTLFEKTPESRSLLQGIGAMIRNEIDQNFWTQYLDNQLATTPKGQDIVISDWRYPNESEQIIREYDCPKDPVYTVRVVRPNAPPIEAGAQHESEVSLTDNMTYSHVFYNVSTRDALEREVEEWARERCSKK